MYTGSISCQTLFLLLLVYVKEEFFPCIFFCVYMDDLSKKLNNVNAGCIIGAALINHLMYADDLVLFAPSSLGLSMLLSACSDYGLEHDIKYNSTKSNVMIFCCKTFRYIYTKLCVK